MAKIRFYLKNQTAKRETSIFMMLNYRDFKIINGKKKYLPLKYYIGESIPPVYWNKRTNKAKETKAYPQHIQLNQRLTTIENIAQTLLLDFKRNQDIDNPNELRKALDKHIKKREIRKREREYGKDLFSFINQYIQESAGNKSLATIRQYRNTLRLLKDYHKTIQNIDFPDINLSFYSAFKSYMDSLGYAEAYFSNQIKFIRLFMNEATERGYNEHLHYKSRKFLSPQTLAEKIYLTNEEIEHIGKLKISNQEKMEKVRDVFIVACKTGLRFSDLIRLKPVNFMVEESILRIKTKKTGALVYIPLSPDVLNICKKYGFYLPKFSNSTFNSYLKEVGKLAGLTDEIELSLSKGNQIFRKTFLKYELLSSHCGRRSFATNAYLAKVPSISIMQITGHATEKAFMRYIRISGEDNAKQLLQHPYFSKK